MDNLNVDGMNLGEIFNNMKAGDPAYVATIEIARKESIGVEPVERKPILENIDMDKLKKCIMGIIVAGLISVSTISIGVNTINEINNPLNMSNLSREIGGIVSQVDDTHLQSIVSQNTHFNGETSYYDQEGIAKDLLSLDSSLFDYAFCSVCDDMGSNINNKVGLNGMSNIDTVIYYLNMYSKMDGKYFNQYVSNMFNSVSSLDDYLLKNNFVDGGGNPSIDAFKTACNSNAEAIYDIIKSEGNKGASL